MAFTVNQSTTGVQGVGDDLIYNVTSDSFASENFRYTLVLKLGSETLVTLQQLPNSNGSTVFNIRTIASNFVQQDDNPYQLGTNNKIFSENISALKTFDVLFGYELSVVAGSAPTQYFEVASDLKIKCVNGSFLSPSLPSPSSSTVAAAYGIDTSGLFLSDITPISGSIEYKTSILWDGNKGQYAALAFLNGDDVGSDNSGFLNIKYYNNSTLLTTSSIQNYATNGGAAPQANLTDEKSLLYVGVGTKNFESQNVANAKPSAGANNGWTKYSIYLSATSGGAAKSRLYTFDRVKCGRYITSDQVYSVHWWNSVGGVDNLPMLGKVSISQNMDKKSFRTSGGNSLEASATVNYTKPSWEGGKRSAKVQTTTTLELTTLGGNPDKLTPLMRSLLNSERVFLSGNGLFGSSKQSPRDAVVQAYVKDVQMQNLTGLDDQAISYKLQLEISRRRANP